MIALHKYYHDDRLISGFLKMTLLSIVLVLLDFRAEGMLIGLIIGLIICFWRIKGGCYDDLDAPPVRLLSDEVESKPKMNDTEFQDKRST
jgi:cbb3-type cytochrome oxidase maturation protein